VDKANRTDSGKVERPARRNALSNGRELKKENHERLSRNIENETLENKDFRRVLYTGKHSQLVLMSLQPKEEIGLETHEENDQFLRFEGGRGSCFIDGNKYDVADGDAVVVPAGAEHNVVNTSETEQLKIYTIYSPPHHKDGTVHATKKEAETDDEEFDGTTTE
jgi:mannose-6-phosphate isomerase-like protein (cupin superfamily)